MTCDEIMSILNGREAVSLSPARRASVDAHLAVCRECAGAWLVVDAIGRERWSDPPEGLLARIVEGLDAHGNIDVAGLGTAPAREIKPPSRSAARTALLAASIAVAFGLAVWLGPEPAVEPGMPSSSPADGSGATATRPAEPGALDPQRAAAPTERPTERAAAERADSSPVAAPAWPLAAYERGRHYRLVSNALPPTTLGSPQNRSFAGALPSPIEVLYFFMYGCFPCYAFEPQIDGWETRADRVELVRVPVVFNRQAELHARAHYTAEALGKLDAMHDAFFTAIHDRGNRLDDEASIAALFAQLGVDDVDFRATFHSPEIDRKLEEAIDLTRSLGVDAVPSLVVGRRYLTSPSMAGSHEEAIEVAEALAESAVSDAQQCEPAVMREPRRQLETISQDGADTETLVELVERAATGCPSRNRIF